jgi:medium-chain acyl-[acyl-carrier-protein] hydrolase
MESDEEKKTLSIPWECSYSFRDLNNNPLPQHILQGFQDAGLAHCAKFGMGFEDLKRDGYCWILIKMHFAILAPIPLLGNRVVTWPFEKGPIRYNREFLIVSQDGKELIKASSEWAIISAATRRLVRGPYDYPENTLLNKCNFPEGFAKFQGFDYQAQKPGYSLDVSYSNLDRNRHANNTDYASWALDSIPGMQDLKLKEMQLEYLAACHLGDHVDIYSHQTAEGKYEIIGVKNNSVISFDVKAVLEHI